MHANTARALVAYVEEHKPLSGSYVFYEIHEAASNGYTYCPFLELSDCIQSELKGLGYAVERLEHSVKVSW